VYDLTLTFDEGTVRKAKIGLVQSWAKGSCSAATRVLSPKDGAAWKGVKHRAVLPVPYGTTSLQVNGVTLDTGFDGAQGWHGLALAPDETAALSAEIGESVWTAWLLGLAKGHVISIR
jgi:hypothetical protein